MGFCPRWFPLDLRSQKFPWCFCIRFPSRGVIGWLDGGISRNFSFVCLRLHLVGITNIRDAIGTVGHGSAWLLAGSRAVSGLAAKTVIFTRQGKDFPAIFLWDSMSCFSHCSSTMIWSLLRSFMVALRYGASLAFMVEGGPMVLSLPLHAIMHLMILSGNAFCMACMIVGWSICFLPTLGNNGSIISTISWKTSWPWLSTGSCSFSDSELSDVFTFLLAKGVKGVLSAGLVLCALAPEIRRRLAGLSTAAHTISIIVKAGSTKLLTGFSTGNVLLSKTLATRRANLRGYNSEKSHERLSVHVRWWFLQWLDAHADHGIWVGQVPETTSWKMLLCEAPSWWDFHSWGPLGHRRHIGLAWHVSNTDKSLGHMEGTSWRNLLVVPNAYVAASGLGTGKSRGTARLGWDSFGVQHGFLSQFSRERWLLNWDHRDHGLHIGLIHMFSGWCLLMTWNNLARPSVVCRSPWLSPKRWDVPPRACTWLDSLLSSLQKTSSRSVGFPIALVLDTWWWSSCYSCSNNCQNCFSLFIWNSSHVSISPAVKAESHESFSAFNCSRDRSTLRRWASSEMALQDWAPDVGESVAMHFPCWASWPGDAGSSASTHGFSTVPSEPSAIIGMALALGRMARPFGAAWLLGVTGACSAWWTWSSCGGLSCCWHCSGCVDWCSRLPGMIGLWGSCRTWSFPSWGPPRWGDRSTPLRRPDCWPGFSAVVVTSRSWWSLGAFTGGKVGTFWSWLASGFDWWFWVGTSIELSKEAFRVPCRLWLFTCVVVGVRMKVSWHEACWWHCISLPYLTWWPDISVQHPSLEISELLFLLDRRGCLAQKFLRPWRHTVSCTPPESTFLRKSFCDLGGALYLAPCLNQLVNIKEVKALWKQFQFHLSTMFRHHQWIGRGVSHCTECSQQGVRQQERCGTRDHCYFQDPYPYRGGGWGGQNQPVEFHFFWLGNPGIVIQPLEWNCKVTFINKPWALVWKYLRLAPEELSASMITASHFLEGCHPYTCAASVWHVLGSSGAKRKYLIFTCLPMTWNDEEYRSWRIHGCKNETLKWNFSMTPPLKFHF